MQLFINYGQYNNAYLLFHFGVETKDNPWGPAFFYRKEAGDTPHAALPNGTLLLSLLLSLMLSLMLSIAAVSAAVSCCCLLFFISAPAQLPRTSLSPSLLLFNCLFLSPCLLLSPYVLLSPFLFFVFSPLGASSCTFVSFSWSVFTSLAVSFLCLLLSCCLLLSFCLLFTVSLSLSVFSRCYLFVCLLPIRPYLYYCICVSPYLSPFRFYFYFYNSFNCLFISSS